MSFMKRMRLALVVLGLSALCCTFLSACGEPVAATYKGGSVTEDEVTQTIENMRVYYELTDDEDWAEFVKTRGYDTGTNGTMTTAVEKAASQAPGVKDEGPREDGTAEDMREYVIEQIIRSKLIEREIHDRNIQVDDELVDMYVDQQRSYVESRLMEGVFESVLQRQGYRDLEEYREEIRDQLKQVMLQNEVSTYTTQYGQEISGKAAWNEWFNNLYDELDVHINPAPDSLSYAIVEGAGSATEGESE